MDHSMSGLSLATNFSASHHDIIQFEAKFSEFMQRLRLTLLKCNTRGEIGNKRSILQDIFHKIDGNDSGILTTEELKAYLISDVWKLIDEGTDFHYEDEDLMQFSKLFIKQIDVNRDGKISLDELEKFLFIEGKTYREPIIALEYVRQHVKSFVSKVAAQDSDDVILAEFAKLVKARFDTQLKIRHVRKALHSMIIPELDDRGGKISESEIDYIVQSLDINGDGVLSAKEFRQWLFPGSHQTTLEYTTAYLKKITIDQFDGNVELLFNALNSRGEVFAHKGDLIVGLKVLDANLTRSEATSMIDCVLNMTSSGNPGAKSRPHQSLCLNDLSDLLGGGQLVNSLEHPYTSERSIPTHVIDRKGIESFDGEEEVVHAINLNNSLSRELDLDQPPPTTVTTTAIAPAITATSTATVKPTALPAAIEDQYHHFIDQLRDQLLLLNNQDTKSAKEMMRSMLLGVDERHDGMISVQEVRDFLLSHELKLFQSEADPNYETFANRLIEQVDIQRDGRISLHALEAVLWPSSPQVETVLQSSQSAVSSSTHPTDTSTTTELATPRDLSTILQYVRQALKQFVSAAATSGTDEAILDKFASLAKVTASRGMLEIRSVRKAFENLKVIELESHGGALTSHEIESIVRSLDVHHDRFVTAREFKVWLLPNSYQMDENRLIEYLKAITRDKFLGRTKDFFENLNSRGGVSIHKADFLLALKVLDANLTKAEALTIYDLIVSHHKKLHQNSSSSHHDINNSSSSNMATSITLAHLTELIGEKVGEINSNSPQNMEKNHSFSSKSHASSSTTTSSSTAAVAALTRDKLSKSESDLSKNKIPTLQVKPTTVNEKIIHSTNISSSSFEYKQIPESVSPVMKTFSRTPNPLERSASSQISPRLSVHSYPDKPSSDRSESIGYIQTPVGNVAYQNHRGRWRGFPHYNWSCCGTSDSICPKASPIQTGGLSPMHQPKPFRTGMNKSNPIQRKSMDTNNLVSSKQQEVRKISEMRNALSNQALSSLRSSVNRKKTTVNRDEVVVTTPHPIALAQTRDSHPSLDHQMDHTPYREGEDRVAVDHSQSFQNYQHTLQSIFEDISSPSQGERTMGKLGNTMNRTMASSSSSSSSRRLGKSLMEFSQNRSTGQGSHETTKRYESWLEDDIGQLRDHVAKLDSTIRTIESSVQNQILLLLMNSEEESQDDVNGSQRFHLKRKSLLHQQVMEILRKELQTYQSDQKPFHLPNDSQRGGSFEGAERTDYVVYLQNERELLLKLIHALELELRNTEIEVANGVLLWLNKMKRAVSHNDEGSVRRKESPGLVNTNHRRKSSGDVRSRSVDSHSIRQPSPSVILRNNYSTLVRLPRSKSGLRDSPWIPNSFHTAPLLRKVSEMEPSTDSSQDVTKQLKFIIRRPPPPPSPSIHKITAEQLPRNESFVLKKDDTTMSLPSKTTPFIDEEFERTLRSSFNENDNDFLYSRRSQTMFDRQQHSSINPSEYRTLTRSFHQRLDQSFSSWKAKHGVHKKIQSLSNISSLDLHRDRFTWNSSDESSSRISPQPVIVHLKGAVREDIDMPAFQWHDHEETRRIGNNQRKTDFENLDEYSLDDHGLWWDRIKSLKDHFEYIGYFE